MSEAKEWMPLCNINMVLIPVNRYMIRTNHSLGVCPCFPYLRLISFLHIRVQRVPPRLPLPHLRLPARDVHSYLGTPHVSQAGVPSPRLAFVLFQLTVDLVPAGHAFTGISSFLHSYATVKKE